MNLTLALPFKKSNGHAQSLAQKFTAKKKQTAKYKVALCIDIGSCYTKMLLGRQRPNGLFIEQNRTVGTPEGAYADGTIINAAQLAPMLNNLTSRDSGVTKDLIFSIESTKIIKREFVIPKIPDEDILGLVTYEMMQYLPIDISEYTIQPKVIGDVSEEDAEKIKVSVNAVPKSIIQAYQRLFTSAGLKPISMDINSNSVEKMIQCDMARNPSSEYAEKNIVFIDMGHSFFNVSVYENGKYQFNRAIEIGGRMLDQKISELLKVDIKKAEHVKKELCGQISVMELDKKYGHMPDDHKPQTIYEHTLIEFMSIINQWANQVDKVLQYMIRSRERKIDRIYIYGGGSLISGISEFFEQKLAIQTVPAGAHRCCEYGPAVNAQNIMLTHGNALGALLIV